jgi:hypothetical protein
MSSIQDVYNLMFTGETIKVVCETPEQFHSLRTALCKKNQISVALEITDKSVVATYEPPYGLFKLADSKRKLSANRWQIVENDGE